MALAPYTEAIVGNTCTRYFGTAAPTSAESEYTFKVGDEVVNTVPTAGGTDKWKCTTAGAGGTAVFKAVAIAA